MIRARSVLTCGYTNGIDLEKRESGEEIRNETMRRGGHRHPVISALHSHSMPHSLEMATLASDCVYFCEIPQSATSLWSISYVTSQP